MQPRNRWNVNAICLASAMALCLSTCFSGCERIEPGPLVSQTEFDEALNSNPTVLVKFGATWCVPCQQMHSELESLKNSGFEGSILEVDVDTNPELVKQFQVSGIPHTILFRNSKPVDKSIGKLTKDELQKWINSKLDQ